MNRFLVCLSVSVSFQFTLSAKTCAVKAYDMTLRHSYHTSQKTHPIKLPEPNRETYVGDIGLSGVVLQNSDIIFIGIKEKIKNGWNRIYTTQNY